MVNGWMGGWRMILRSFRSLEGSFAFFVVGRLFIFFCICSIHVLAAITILRSGKYYFFLFFFSFLYEVTICSCGLLLGVLR
ncbi:hypothetical protein DFP73DRAFT_547392 [Morchella snyderi]|nr:hypothetical protein DFP73DRAFT_547392 [Morchella snyderi]